jgi:sugar phosphate isomerase/epimerase
VELEAKNELSAANLTKSGIRHVRKLLDDANVRPVALAFYTQRGYDSADQLDRRVDATERTLQLAYDLGAPVVINRLGRLPAAGTPERDTFLGALADLGAHGQRVGATLCHTTSGESSEKLLELLGLLPSGSIGLDFDPAAFLLHGHVPADAITLLASHVYHFRALDATRDVTLRTGSWTPLGAGSCELPVLLAILQTSEYRGAVTCQQQAETGGAAGVAQAVQFLKRLQQG